ncbi:MAG: carbohydrate-binding protein [Phycisphaerae bacterium]|jgi:fibronectin type 3 domain-containing protein
MVCIFFVVCPAYCSDYFVDPNGNDSNPGTIDYPFATIPTAVTAATAGDTIYLRGGTHIYTTTISISKDGTSGSRYYMFAYPGERPVLDFSAMAESGSNRGIILSGDYWHIKGIDVYGAGDNGMNISGGSYNIIEFCRFYENHDTGLQIGGGATYNQIINCDSYYNADSSLENADGFAPKLDIGTGNYFYGCRSWQNLDDGYDGYLRPSDGILTTYENCWAFKNGYLKNGQASSGDGNGFKMGGSDDKTLRHNVILINCLSFQNAVKGFDQNNNKGSMTLYNCTAFNNGSYNYNIPLALASGSTATLTNCVYYLGSNSLGSFVVQTTNSWQSPFSVSSGDFVSVDPSAAYGPRQADGSLPDITFMHLAAGSDLIDGGTDVGLPYNGSAPDLGCYEYTVSNVDYPPASPAGLSATGYNGSVGLNWNDNSESDLDGYNIYRSTTSGSGYSKLNGSLLSNSNYTDDSVINNTTYYYVVTAVDVNEHESNYSSQVSATPADTDAPATPTGLIAGAGDQIVILGWNDNTEPDLAGYNIYRSTTSGSGYIKLNSSLLSSPDYSDSSVTNTITYYYVVTAVDTSSNESAHSGEVTAIPTIYGDFIVNGIVEIDDLAYLCNLWLVNDCEATTLADIDDDCTVNFYEFSAFANNWMIIPPDINAPAPPTGLSAMAGDATVSLNWNDNSESDLTGYNIYRSTTSGSGYSKLNSSLLSTSDYTDNSVINGTTYYYVVTAVDTSANESAYSSQVSTTPAAPVTSITIQENTDGYCGIDGTIDTNHNGYTGTGFANTTNDTGQSIDWSINVLATGTYTFTWRYANGSTTTRPGNLIINGSTVVSGISFPVTSDWDTWTTVSTNVSLTTGIKSISLESTTSDGLTNIDYVEITGPNLTTATCQ